MDETEIRKFAVEYVLRLWEVSKTSSVYMDEVAKCADILARYIITGKMPE